MQPPKRITPKRLFFPIVNMIVFAMLFFVIGYYVLDPLRWIIIGALVGFGVGLAVELGFGAVGGWLYRRRVTIAVLLEVVLIIAYVGPFILVYLQTTPESYTVCCIEDSGLGDRVEVVQIPAADGVTLAGWYAPPAEDNRAVVLVLHGSRGNRMGSRWHARVLHDAGYGVLIYDQRASGESTGDRQSMGLHDQRDITPIIDWLAARPEVNSDRVGGVGLSLGAHILVMAAPDEPRLAAVWSDGLGINGRDDIPPYPGLGDQLITFINGQAFWIAGLYLGESPIPFQQLIPQIAPRHLMLVAGGRDPNETDFNRGYEPFLGENGELWVIENAPHVGGLGTVPEEYTARMLAFFAAALR